MEEYKLGKERVLRGLVSALLRPSLDSFESALVQLTLLLTLKAAAGLGLSWITATIRPSILMMQHLITYLR